MELGIYVKAYTMAATKVGIYSSPVVGSKKRLIAEVITCGNEEVAAAKTATPIDSDDESDDKVEELFSAEAEEREE